MNDDSRVVLNSMTLKHRFLAAVAAGHLGSIDDAGIVVTLKEFKDYFSDIQTQYISSFLPASTIEVGQSSATRTKFVFRVSKGVYRVHPHALEEFVREFGIMPYNLHKRTSYS